MKDLDAVKRFVEWQEDSRLAGKSDVSVEAYEEHMRQTDAADRLAQIAVLADTTAPVAPQGFLPLDERLSLILSLAKTA